MNPVEDALIRRLDARQAFARTLGRQNERNRAILVEVWRGGTYRGVGERFSLSPERIRQICNRGFRQLQSSLKEKLRPASVPLRRAPPGFDKAAFLEHMRGVIRRREEAKAEVERQTWKREMAVLSHFVDMATPEQPASPPQIARLPVSYAVHAPYVPPPPPTSAEQLALEALHSFMGVRLPGERGNERLGERYSTVSFTIAGPVNPLDLDEGMRRLAAEIPEDAVLSVGYLSAAQTQHCATASNEHVAVQAIVVSHNAFNGVASYRLAITWDYAPDAY